MAAPEQMVVLLACADSNKVGLIGQAFKRLTNIARMIPIEDGDTAVAYLEGDGKYADRTAWPLPRLLVIDEWLPHLSGIEVLRWARADARFRDLPVVILSEVSPPSQPELVERMKAAYCPKAIRLSDMAAALETAVCTALRLAWPSALTSTAAWFVPQASPSVSLKIRPECSQ